MGKRCPRCGLVKSRDEYYRNKASHDGLQSCCKPCHSKYTIGRRPPAKPRKPSLTTLERYHANNPREPLVYFIGPDPIGSGPIKIGSTDNLPFRLNMLRCGSPVPLAVYGSIKCESRKEAFVREHELQRQFRHLRSHGEWLKYDPSILGVLDESK